MRRAGQPCPRMRSPKHAEIQALVLSETFSASLGPFWMMLHHQVGGVRRRSRNDSQIKQASVACRFKTWPPAATSQAHVWHPRNQPSQLPLHSLVAANEDGEEGEERQHPQGQQVGILAAQHYRRVGEGAAAEHSVGGAARGQARACAPLACSGCAAPRTPRLPPGCRGSSGGCGAPAWRVKRNRMAPPMADSRGEVNQEMTITDTPCQGQKTGRTR